MSSETITWISVAESLPDADRTVLGFNATWDEPLWLCYLDGEDWRDVDGTLLHDEETEGEPNPDAPTHWADLPEGPTT